MNKLNCLITILIMRINKIILKLLCTIINFFIDCTTTPVVGGGTATAVNATIGTAAAGTQYLSATDVIAGGRAALTFTAAQLTAMEDVNNNTTIAFTVDPNGTVSTTQGVYRLTVVYAQKV